MFQNDNCRMTVIRLSISTNAASSRKGAEGGGQRNGEKVVKHFCIPATLFAGHSKLVEEMLLSCDEEREESGATRTATDGETFQLVRWSSGEEGEGGEEEEADSLHSFIDLPLSEGAGHCSNDVLALLVEWVAHYSQAGTAVAATLCKNDSTVQHGDNETDGGGAPPHTPLIERLLATKSGDDNSLPPSVSVSGGGRGIATAVEPPTLPLRGPKLLSTHNSSGNAKKERGGLAALFPRQQVAETSAGEEDDGVLPSADSLYATTPFIYFVARTVLQGSSHWESEFIVNSVLLGGGVGEEDGPDEHNDSDNDVYSRAARVMLSEIILPMASGESKRSSAVAEGAPSLRLPSSGLVPPAVLLRFHRRLYFLSSLALYLDMPRLHSLCALVTASLLLCVLQLKTAPVHSQRVDDEARRIDGKEENVPPKQNQQQQPSCGQAQDEKQSFVAVRRIDKAALEREEKALAGVAVAPQTLSSCCDSAAPSAGGNASAVLLRIIPSDVAIRGAVANTIPDRPVAPRPFRGDGFSEVHYHNTIGDDQLTQQQTAGGNSGGAGDGGARTGPTFYNPSHLASNFQATHSVHVPNRRFDNDDANAAVLHGEAPINPPRFTATTTAPIGSGAKQRAGGKVGNGDAAPLAVRVNECITVYERQKAVRSWFTSASSSHDGTATNESANTTNSNSHDSEGDGWLTASDKAAIGDRFTWCTNE